jgi:ectoine hydroxylase-related dioxygenase (phytanoyl-CoA dioxygenase family)
VHEFTIGRCHNVVGQRHVVCPAGSVVIFHHGLWHAGQPNAGDTPRYALKLRLNPSVKQERLFDSRDLDSPAVKDALLPHATADIEYYLTRLENQAEHDCR